MKKICQKKEQFVDEKVSEARKSIQERLNRAIEKVKTDKSKKNVDEAMSLVRADDALKISDKGLTSDDISKWSKKKR